MQILELRLDAAATGRRRDVDRRRPPSVVSGGPFRVIEGGRTGEPTPGLLIVGARRDRDARRRASGVARRRPMSARLAARGPGRRRTPGVAVLGRPDRCAVGPRAAVEAALEGDGYRSLGSRASMPPADRSRLAWSIRTRTCCSRARARTSSSCDSKARPTSTSSRRAAGSSRRSPPPAPPPRRAARPRPSLARRDAGATGSRRSRRSPATASTSRPSSDSSKSPTGSAARARSTSCRHGSGAHAVAARVPHTTRRRPRRTSAHLIDDQLPGIAAHGRARFADVFCETGVFSADQSRRVLEAAVRARAGAAAPRRRARAVAAARSSPRSSAQRRPTTSRHPVRGGDRRPRWRRRRRDQPGGRHAAAQSRPGSS